MNETLRALREQNNYSQAAVASYLGISRQMYIKYENGDASPPVKIVMELSNFYRVPYDVILENKLKAQKTEIKEKPDRTIYTISEAEPLECHDSGAVYSPAQDNPSYYLKSVLEMLPKLVYKEQLKVLEKISGMVQKATEEKLKPKKEMQKYTSLSRYANSLHLHSDGKKWTREELYER
ncbi:MAG: helix-turn-helix domain-containing protein [Treponema sp.]|nr:helix-turn-helix domain-containing protein [Treponema sp.]